MKDELRVVIGGALHPSASAFILHPFTAPRAKKLLHDLSAVFLEHAGCKIDLVI
jgi:hypothetical protein